MTKKRKKKKSSGLMVAVFCIFLTIALILVGLLAAGAYMKKNEPERYEAVMNELRGVKPTEAEEVLLPMPTNGALVDDQDTSSGLQAYDDLGAVSVTGGNGTVTVTLPADFAGDVEPGNGVVDAVTNADGTVTLTLTEEKHQEMLSGIAKAVDDAIDSIMKDGTYSTVTGITHNDDFTVFTVCVNDEERFRNSLDNLVITNLWLYALTYQQFHGIAAPGADIRVVDDAGIELFSEHYPQA